ncbi:hypothetical protein ACFLX5_01595 [Chloroflexota bacterium]
MLIVTGVLAAIVVSNVAGFPGRAKERSWKDDQDTLSMAVNDYYAQENEYPFFGAGGSSSTGEPDWNGKGFDLGKGAINMLLLGGYLAETLESASDTNGGSGSYTWYVGADGKVMSCGPAEADDGYVDGVYP